MKVPIPTAKQNPKTESGQYFQAVISAIKRIWKFKFLWFWGVFLPAGISMNNYRAGEEEMGNINPNNLSFQAQQFWMEHSWWIILAAGVLLVLMIAVWIISSIARGGVISSLNDLQEKKEEEYEKINQKDQFKKVWQVGKLRFWNIVKLDLLFFLITLIILAVITPSIFFTLKAGNPTATFFVVLLAVVIFIPIAFLVIFTKNISLVFVALAKEKPLKSIELGYSLLIRNKKEAAKLILTLFLLLIATGIAFAIILTVIGGILLLLFGLTFTLAKAGLVTLIVGIVLALILLSFLLLIKSITALWHQDIWVWWVKKIGGAKAEESETADLPVEENLTEKEPAIVAKEKLN